MKRKCIPISNLSTDALDKVLERATKFVIPDPVEVKKLKDVALKVTTLVNEALKKEAADPRPEIVLGGSYARGTWLKGNQDIDFFLQYPLEFSREKLESVAIRSATDAMAGYPVKLRYAEHPYVEAFVDNVRVNLVPCYKVQLGQWRSAADRSPYHTKYISSKLDDKLRLDARLFKKFAKCAGVYGAEVKIQGFSGYACEVLTIWGQSFIGTLERLANLKPKDVISLEEYDKELAGSFESPIVLLDPVDTTRNLGTAISARNAAKLVLESRRFLRAPRLSFFQTREAKKVIPNAKKKELLSRVYIISFRNEARSPDILWGQLRRSASALSDKLSRIGYQILRSAIASNEGTHSALLILVSDHRLGELQTRKGPEYYRAQEVFSYLEKNEQKALHTWIAEDGRMVSIFEREKNSIEIRKCLMNLLSGKEIETIGLSEEIKKEIRKNHQILNGLNTVRSSKEPRNWLTKEVLALVIQE
jgi:tRNA nucleotidyltransferase (CCA-adding enzyme)